MSHLRKVIRDQILALLTGLATTGTNVYAARVYPIERSGLPGLAVRTGTETIKPLSLRAPRTFERYLRVEVGIVVRSTDNLDDAIDAIVLEVETVLAMPNSITGIKTITLLGISEPQFVVADKPVAEAIMHFEVFYMAAESTPDVAD